MRRIPLRRRDGSVRDFTLVDDADYPALAQYRWHRNSVSHDRDARGYAVRWDPGAPRRLIGMSRELLGLRPGDKDEADHINGDTLDNRRQNLRVVTHAQNMQNRSSHRRGTSRFRGVYWNSRKQRWHARGQINNKQISAGHFKDEIDAALAAEAWRKTHMPFAQSDPALAEALGDFAIQEAA